MMKRFGVIAIVAALAALVALSACSSGGGSSSSSSSASPSSASSSSSVTKTDSEDVVTIGLDYNAGTGYEWICTVEPEDAVTDLGRTTEDLAADKTIAGGPLRDNFTFRAAKPGEVTITFNLIRSWEGDPADTQVYAFTISDDLKMTLNPYKSNFENEPVWGSNA